MAKTSRLLFSLSLVVLLLLVESTAPHGQADAIDNGSSCSYRCRIAGRPKTCLRACGICCQRCGCVPPGTSGNQDACPCYANMRTHDGKRKCP